VQRIDHQQTQDPLSVALIGLHAIPGGTLDLPWRRHNTAHAARSARARPSAVGPASYATPVGPGSEAQKSTTPLVSPDSLRTPNPPVPLSMLAASTLRACTSRPAQLRTFAMVGTSHMDVVLDRRGVTLAVSHSPHAMRAGCRPMFDTTTGRPP
jgi:hypothetical protein